MRFGLAVVATLLAALPAYAQNAAPLSPPNASGNGPGTPSPTHDPGVATAPAVIQPGNPDPGMSVRPPSAGTMPVIPPSGTGGDNSTVVPK